MKNSKKGTENPKQKRSWRQKYDMQYKSQGSSTVIMKCEMKVQIIGFSENKCSSLVSLQRKTKETFPLSRVRVLTKSYIMSVKKNCASNKKGVLTPYN
jgi:hypothetical protein